MKLTQYMLRNTRIDRYQVLVGLLLSCSVISCEKFLDIEPGKAYLEKGQVFENDIGAVSAVSGVYSSLYQESYASGNQGSVMLLCALSSDELRHYDPQPGVANVVEFETNELTAENTLVLNLWTNAYKTIYNANSVIEGLSTSTSVTDSLKRQLRGEMLFIRAFTHFQLTNLFGDIPIVLTTAYKDNAVIKRSSVENVYAQLIKDVVEAETLLWTRYPSTGRVRINKSVAKAFLARVYLYMKDYIKAEEFATSVIDEPMYKLLSGMEMDNIFLSSSEEAIWQLLPATTGFSTNEGRLFVLRSGVPSNSNPFLLQDGLVNSFEAGDQRKAKWVGVSSGFNFPNKYKVYTGAVTEYSMVIRLAEQYLIRAEARAKLGKLTGSNSSQEDINAIRTRAGLSATTAATETDLLAVIEKERRVEFFTEWGHRWFDLKRRERATAVVGAVKPGWQATDTLYPLPQKEMNNNPYLKPQNSGY